MIKRKSILVAFTPSGSAVTLFLLRTAREDRILDTEQPGYLVTIRIINSRLLPGS